MVKNLISLICFLFCFFILSSVNAREQPKPLKLHEQMRQLHYDIAKQNHNNPGVPENWNKRRTPKPFEYKYNRKHSTYKEFEKYVIDYNKGKH